MRILFLTHAFNSLSQRLHAELSARGHQLSLELDITDSVAEEAVRLFAPQVVLAPYLRRAIPRSIWSKVPCLVVHPGVVGDRGPSALDWALQEGLPGWGVTVLQAEAALDGGPVWATRAFPLRPARKASVYRQEVTEAAVEAVLEALEKLASGGKPTPLAELKAEGRARPLMKQADRAIDWARDDSATVLRRLAAADGFPGVADALFGVPCHLYDAWPEATVKGGPPGTLLGRRETALLRATVDGAVWLGHVKRSGEEGAVKLPAAVAFETEAAALPELPLDGWWASPSATWQDIAYREAGPVGFLAFDFYNGAMGTRQCQRLLEAYRWACTRPTRVLVLEGGTDFWSNGIHLNLIEAASSPAEESWRNINAIDDLAEAVLRTEDRLTVAALAGNAGAGGAFLARAADLAWAREGVLLNPHYKNMGNLYGSELWTYTLPPRVGEAGARALMQDRMPLTAAAGVKLGFLDAAFEREPRAFRAEVARRALALASGEALPTLLAGKVERRRADEARKPLARYREEELQAMHRNFYGFDPSYHVARYHFVRKSPHSWTPRHLARHRELGWKVPS